MRATSSSRVASGRGRRSRSSSRGSRRRERKLTKILIAEDDPRVASLLEKGLRSKGFSTLVADDGKQAQELALADEFDLLILDMGLPVLDGFQVLRELRSRGSRIPVLVLTGRSERDAAMCLEAGADDYMRKPFRFDELLARVRARLRMKEELDRMRAALGEGATGGQDPDR